MASNWLAGGACVFRIKAVAKAVILSFVLAVVSHLGNAVTTGASNGSEAVNSFDEVSKGQFTPPSSMLVRVGPLRTS